MGCSRVLDCEQIQAAISARLDGEPTGIPEDVIDAHIAGCPECRAYQESIVMLDASLKRSQPSPAAHGPRKDLADVILADAEPHLRRRAASRALGLALTRTALCVLAALYVVWAVVLLIHAADIPVAETAAGAGAEAGRGAEVTFMVEAAAVRIALASGLLFGAWWPRLVAGMLPMMGTYFMFTAGITMRDLILGSASHEQWIHLLMLLLSLAVLLWSWLNNYGIDAFRRYWGTLGSGSTSGP